MKNLILILVLLISTIANAQWQIINGLPYDTRSWDIYTRGDSVYVCNDSGLYVSPNAGQTWVKKSDRVFNTITFDYYRGYLVAGGRSGIISRSTNNGTTWEDQTTGGILDSVMIYLIKCEGIFTFVGISGGLYRAQGLYGFWKSLSNVTSQDMLIKGSTLFLAAGRIYRSTNNGTNWTIVKDTNAFTSLTTDGINIYAGGFGESYGRGVWKSSNNGNTWMRIGLSNSYVYSLVSSGNYIFAGTSDSGVYVYNGSTNTWFKKNQGLPGSSATPLAIGNNYIYAAISSNSAPNYSTWRRSISDIISVRNISTEVPDKFSLSQNYPNPFNPSTTIRYQISKAQYIDLRVFDITGKVVTVLVSESQTPGTYEVNWNASQYSSGVYFYRFETGSYTETKSMLLVK